MDAVQKANSGHPGA
ncbi:ribulose phosphate epimerase, partial [Klebsiella pneumoniae]|nr:ribulose phosphate epimerase [Klebsiella pneumoniae]MDD1619799.1 ribulose phosphate epimerase [Methylococcaceae bacterium]